MKTLKEYSTDRPPGTTGKKIEPLSKRIEIFWSYVNKLPEDGCWEWTRGKLQSGGYGQFNINGTIWRTHVLSWVIANGSLEDDVIVRHRCDNPKCVRPDHLQIGTHLENMKDMIDRGRAVHAWGESTPVSKLTLDQVETLLCIWKTGLVTKAQLSRHYKISRGNVSMIISGCGWKQAVAKNLNQEILDLAQQIKRDPITKKSSTSFSSGNLHPNAKLTDDDVLEIRCNYKWGMGAILAKKFGVTIQTIRNIARGKSRPNV